MYSNTKPHHSMADKENRASGRYSTFSTFALDILREFYRINGFPTKNERMQICEIIGETEKRVQNWFKGQRKVDRKRDRKVASGDASEFLMELEKTRSVFQLCQTSLKRKRDDQTKDEAHDDSTTNEGPSNTVQETVRVLKEEPRLTPSVWPHPLPLSAPALDSIPYGFPALTSALPMTTNKTPKKYMSFIPTLTESSSVRNSLRIKNPFEEDPTPTKKRRKLSNDVTGFDYSVDTVMEDILNGTSALLPHINSFLWGTEGPRFT